MWYGDCKKGWEWRNAEGKAGRGTKVKCTKCGRKDTVVDEKIGKEKLKEILCPECRMEKKVPWNNWEVVVHPKKEKAQQGGAWRKTLKGAAREGGERDIRRTFKLLKEVWLNIGVEKTETHKGISVKALLDSGATGMFMDRKFTAKHGFRLLKLERPLLVRNVNGMTNSGGSIIYEVEANVYYKNHVEKMKMDICDLEKTSVILGMP